MILNVLFVLALTGQGATSGAVAHDPVAEAYHLFLEGRLLENQEDLPGAMKRYQQALSLLPKSASLRAELANIYARLGQLDDARAEAERALAIEPDHRDAHRLLGLLQSSAIQTAREGNEQEVKAAIAHLEQAIAGAPPDLPVQFTLGELYIRDKQYPKAIATLQQFLADRPDYPQALVLLTQAYRESGRPEEAQKVWASLLRTRPNLESVRAAEAERLEQAERWREAARVWDEIVQSSPNGARYRTRHALALANSGDLPASRAVLQSLTAEDSRDIGAWYLLAQVESRGGNLAAAESAARRILDIDAADSRGPLALVGILDARGDHKGVVDLLTPRVSAPPDGDIASGAFAQMASQLSAAYTGLKQPRRAIETLERAYDRAPNDDAIAFSLGAAYENNRRFDQAERVFRDVIARSPTHAPALNYLGYMLADRNRKLEEALALIERALAVDADNPAYLDSLGWVYFRLKRFDEARVPLERAAAAMPESSVVQDHLGDYYLQVQRYADAAAAFDRALSGDRDGVDVGDLTKKRDRARSLVRQ